MYVGKEHEGERRFFVLAWKKIREATGRLLEERGRENTAINHLRTTNHPKLRSIIFEKESGTLVSSSAHASSTRASA